MIHTTNGREVPCIAFPSGIPDEIFLALKLHNEILPDQEGDYIFKNNMKILLNNIGQRQEIVIRQEDISSYALSNRSLSHTEALAEIFARYEVGLPVLTEWATFFNIYNRSLHKVKTQ
jgi:hypothetical protein